MVSSPTFAPFARVRENHFGTRPRSPSDFGWRLNDEAGLTFAPIPGKDAQDAKPTFFYGCTPCKLQGFW